MRIHRKTIHAALAALAILGGATALTTVGVSPDGARAAESTAPAWAIQPGGELTFSVNNDGTPVEGGFTRWGGAIQFDPDAPGAAAIKIDVDLTSASVGESFKDGLLQDDEFFATSVTPTATFTSSSVEALPDGRFVAHGELSLRGLSMAQDVEFRLSGSGAERHVEGQAMIDRLDFGIGTGSHGGGLDNTVGLTFSFDAKRG
jgi:polyisoprenoid-binding protein YceI